jgi:hypothetical protein
MILCKDATAYHISGIVVLELIYLVERKALTGGRGNDDKVTK